MFVAAIWIAAALTVSGLGFGMAAVAQTWPAPPPNLLPWPGDTGPQPRLVYSPWTKICDKDQADPEGRPLCLVIQEVRLDTGQFLASAVLVEPQSGAARVLRVTVPLGVRLQAGSRILVDQGKPIERPYTICFQIGCISDFEVGAELMDQLKGGHSLVLEAVNAGGQPITLDLPLSDFAKAYQGPASDPSVLAERQKKLTDELRSRAATPEPRDGASGRSAAPAK
jgi:invasion protein IalB